MRRRSRDDEATTHRPGLLWATGLAVLLLATFLFAWAGPAVAHDLDGNCEGPHMGRSAMIDDTVSPSDDLDRYRITAFDSEDISASINSQDGNELRLELRYPLYRDGEVFGCGLADSTETIGIDSVSVDDASPSGPWFVDVECWGCGEESRYHLEIDTDTDDAGLDLDAGDGPGSATMLPGPGIYGAALHDRTPDWPSAPSDTADWWSVQLPPMSELEVTMEPECFPPDAPSRTMDLELRSADPVNGGSDFVASYASTTCHDRVVSCSTVLGNTALIGVEHDGGPAGGYDLTVRVSNNDLILPGSSCDGVL